MMGYLLLTSASPKASQWWFEGADKVAHFGMFSVWAFLLYGALSKKAVDRPAVWKVILAAVLFGVFTELVQYFVPKRAADINDFFADMVGASLGLLVAYFLKKELNRRVKKLD